MKICLVADAAMHIFPHLGCGGNQSCVENLAQGLHQAGEDFFVICPKRDSNENYPFKIIELDFLPYLENDVSDREQYWKQARAVIQAEQPDLVLTQSTFYSRRFARASKKIIVTMHCSGGRNRKTPHRKNVLYRYISQHQYNQWVSSEKQQRDSFWCYTGFTDQEYQLNLQPKDYFLWVANLDWGWQRKGLDKFVMLAEHYREKEFVAYGKGNLEIEQRLQQLDKQLSNFHYGGLLVRGEQHRKAFSEAKALVQLSIIDEAYGRINVEAMTKGTPVITNYSGANPEIIGEHGGVRTQSDDEVIAAIEKIDQLNRSDVFNYSQKFHVRHEVENLLAHANAE